MTPQRKKLTTVDKLEIRILLETRVKENEKDIKEVYTGEEYERARELINKENENYREIIEKLS